MFRLGMSRPTPWPAFTYGRICQSGDTFVFFSQAFWCQIQKTYSSVEMIFLFLKYQYACCNILPFLPDCAAPRTHPEWNGCDSDTDWWHWTRRVHPPSSWPAVPDPEERPPEVAPGFVGRRRHELTLLEEGAIPDAHGTRCHQALNQALCFTNTYLRHIWFKFMTTIELANLI